jgi:hypothetical protein
MRTEKNHKAQDFDGKSHNACPIPERSPIYVAAGMMASAIALSTACAGFGNAVAGTDKSTALAQD